MYMYNFKSSCHSISMHVLLFAIIVIVMAVICGGWSLSSSSWPSCFASCCSCCSSHSSCSSGSSSSSSSSSTQHILKITVPASFQSICGFHPSNPKVGILSTKILRMTISMHLKISLLLHLCSLPAIPTLHAKDQKSWKKVGHPAPPEHSDELGSSYWA